MEEPMDLVMDLDYMHLAVLHLKQSHLNNYRQSPQVMERLYEAHGIIPQVRQKIP